MAIASKLNLGDDRRVNTNNGGKKEKEDKSRKQSDDGGCDFPAKRTKCPGVRVVGGRIYDSENGKTCHQCRQKTMDFMASCKNHQKDKPCTIKFCHKCLLNRYGEKAEDIEVLEDWNCPKCRGICNCSFCMKKRGHQPTGILVHTAKATGFSSVSELLHNKGPENFGIDKIAKPVDSGPRKAVASNNEPAVALPRKLGKENCSSDSSLQFLPLPSRPAKKKLKKMKREMLKDIQDGNQDDDGLLKEASPIKPQISDESLKQMKDGNRNDGVLSKKNSTRKAPVAEKGLKDIQEGIKCDGILSKAANTKKPRISKEGLTETQGGGKGDNGDIKKEVKTSGKVEAVLEKEKNLKTKVCKGVSSSLIRYEEEQRNRRPQKGALMLDGRKLDKDGTYPHIDVEACEVHQNAMMFQNENIDANVPLPQSTELTTVAGIDLPPQDVGHALQFLEFCAAFEEILDLKKGEPEYVLRELIHERRGRRGKYSPVVQFHIRLLSLIQMDLGEDSTVENPKNGKNSWLQTLKNCASTSQCVLKDLKLDWLDQEADDYGSLDSSKKLRLLTFLCDEVLCTAKIRSWIEDQNLKFFQKLKEAKERVLVAKHKEKLLKKKMLDEMAKAIMAKNGAPLSISEHEAVVLEIKAEAAQAHAEMLKSKDMVPNDKRSPDALRTEPILLDINGHAFWTLKGYSDSNVLLQDVGNWDAVGSVEKWFIFNVEQEKEVDKYIYSLRKRKLQSQKFNDEYSSRISVEDMAVQ